MAGSYQMSVYQDKPLGRWYTGGMEGYLTVAEASEVLGVSVEVVRKRLQRGLMAGERVGARVWVVPRAEVDRWVPRGKLPRGRKSQQPEAGTESR